MASIFYGDWSPMMLLLTQWRATEVSFFSHQFYSISYGSTETQLRMRALGVIPLSCLNLSISLVALLLPLGLLLQPVLPKPWHPLPSGWIKINSNAAINHDAATIDCVARDDFGLIICCKSKRMVSSSPQGAEGSVELAFELACDGGCRF